MKEIKEYIVEKLTIDKHIKVRKKDITVLSEKYQKGDICLYVKTTGYRSQERILIDVVEILQVQKTQIRFKFLSKICLNYGSAFLKMGNNDVKIQTNMCSPRYMSSSGGATSTMIIPDNLSLEVLEKIRKNNNSLDFYGELWYGIGGKQEDKPSNRVPIMQRKVESPSGFSDYEKISEENLDKIEEILKNRGVN